MQKGLILYMGYYGRYTAAYSIGCLLMLSLYIAGIFLHWAAFGVLLVLTLAGVMLLAVICSVLGTRRFNAAYQRFLTSCDAAAFLAEIRGCQRWQNRSTRPNLALNESFALQALGRGPEALEALSRMGMDRVPRRSKSYLQQLRLSVYTRQASIAIGLEDYAAARSQLAYLRDEVRTLPAGNALFGHFSGASRAATPPISAPSWGLLPTATSGRRRAIIWPAHCFWRKTMQPAPFPCMSRPARLRPSSGWRRGQAPR